MVLNRPLAQRIWRATLLRLGLGVESPKRNVGFGNAQDAHSEKSALYKL